MHVRLLVNKKILCPGGLTCFLFFVFKKKRGHKKLDLLKMFESTSGRNSWNHSCTTA